MAQSWSVTWTRTDSIGLGLRRWWTCYKYAVKTDIGRSLFEKELGRL